MAILTGVTMLLKLKSVINLLVKNWKIVLVVLMLIGVWFYHNSRSNTISELENEVVLLTTNLQNCTGAIDNQNGIIDTLKNTGREILQEERIRAAKKAAEIKEKNKAMIDLLKNKPLAANCKDAINELMEFGRAGE